MSRNTKIRDSIVGILTHQDQVFVIQRQPYLKAFPGYHSFPGGKVDRDESNQPYQTEFLQDHEAILMRALCRELQEEINFDLEQAIQNNLVNRFHRFGEAITPVFSPIRFHAHFFKIELNEPLDFDVDSNEAAWSGWETAQEFMHKYETGQMLCAFPALVAMKAFAKDPDTKYVGVMHVQYDPKTEIPLIQPIYQLTQMPVLSNTLPPAERTNAFLIGEAPNERYLVDPSPASQEELVKLIRVLETQNITGIFLTHHHGDHHEHSNELARQYNVPMKMSRDTFERIPTKFGHHYFDGIDVQIAQEGNTLTKWIGKEVKIFEIPGHDEGQLGLAPETMEWFIVGDLFQGVGTVVISAPEGDMKKYFSTLKKVIELDPKIIIPSHGIPVRSTQRLKDILEHRQMREDQILKLHQEGKSNEEVLSEVYQDIDPRLSPFAMQNIESHLTKLKQEELI